MLEQNYQPEINNTDLISANSAYFQTNQVEDSNSESNMVDSNTNSEGFFEDFIKSTPEEEAFLNQPDSSW